ncbi:KWL1 [Linum grandiflorum]
MKNQTLSSILLISFLVLFLTYYVEAQQCKPSGYITGKTPPPGQCNRGEESDCCKKGKRYTTFTCSPSVTAHTKATLTWNSFEKGGSGGAPSECDNQYHSDDKPVVALSTGWFNNKSRCLNFINIHGNGKTVRAMVVDECDSRKGCDSDHDYQPPCPNNIVDASKAVWKALGVPEDNWGNLDIFWSDVNSLAYENSPHTTRKHTINMKGVMAVVLLALLSAVNVESRLILANQTDYNIPSTKLATMSNAKAMLTINGFQKGEDGGGPAECDGNYHSDDTLIVALSTPWYAKGQRCFRSITITASNGKSVSATVVDECDVKHAHCKTNIVDGSTAVWEALNVPHDQWGLMPVTWSDE